LEQRETTSFPVKVTLLETGRKTGNYLRVFSAISYNKGKFRAIIQIQLMAGFCHFWRRQVSKLFIWTCFVYLTDKSVLILDITAGLIRLFRPL
jgi:hypothetical protein